MRQRQIQMTDRHTDLLNIERETDTLTGKSLYKDIEFSLAGACTNRENK